MTTLQAAPTESGSKSGRMFVTAWDDPITEAQGYDPRSPYVELFWLPQLGPSTTWLLRFLANGLSRSPKGFVLDVDHMARCLGVGHRNGRPSAMSRTLERAVGFEMARWTPDGELEIRRRLPPLSARQVAHLPLALQLAHQRIDQQAHGRGFGLLEPNDSGG